ncbi:hypothetical protein [Blastococcus sp. CCUG 61487]|uniref:hypothetical protein n=1 Tax=Blastococcus sp. CCUG 61487 TaxID=1840703 RepID=UPI0010BFB7BA|nr:hypothetical protein [Blastococcus sp. CCUG 61487]TKJ23404.1 hypothetical protein A6V29_05210 [Blastococcus sp. CCUG 61487]
MQLTSSPRRALGVLAAATIGLSTALLGATGVAQAAGYPAPTIQAVEGVDQGLVVFVSYDSDDDPVPTSWEYSINGSDPIPAVDPEPANGFDAVFEIDQLASGDPLVNGTEYTVRVGAPGYDWSAEAKGTPFVRPGVPGVPTAELVDGMLVVSWTAPTSTGTYPLAGYQVDAVVGEDGYVESCLTSALTCSVMPIAGYDYLFLVRAIDAKGNEGEESVAAARTGKIPALAPPASVPAKNGDLTMTGAAPGAVQPGAKVRVTGQGYAPGSTVTVSVYSTPQVLTTIVAGPDGAFSVEVTVPAGLAAGAHTLVASGHDSNGALRHVTLPITVSAGGVATVGQVTAAQATLAATGADVAVPVIGGLAALGLGAGLIVVARRRAAA